MIEGIAKIRHCIKRPADGDDRVGLYEQKVADCHRAERLLHQRLDQYRSMSNRDFFQIPIKAAIKALEGVTDDYRNQEGGELKSLTYSSWSLP
jgi:hypothetical protein